MTALVITPPTRRNKAVSGLPNAVAFSALPKAYPGAVLVLEAFCENRVSSIATPLKCCATTKSSISKDRDLNHIYNRLVLPAGVAIAVLCSMNVEAITREEMLKLNAAYPPGSVVSCETQLEGNGKNILPTLLKTRAHIKERTGNLTRTDVSVTFVPKGLSTHTMTVNYQSRATMEEDGELIDIDPDSLTVSFSTANPEGGAIVANKMRSLIPPTGSDLRLYKTVKITDFPSFIITPQDQPPTHCFKEK